MKNKSLFLLIPVMLLPYVVMAAFVVVLFSPNVMEIVFKGNAINLVITLLIYILVSLLLLIAFVIIHFINKTDGKWLALTALVIKLVQIPAYVFIFICSALCFITIFTIPFALVYFVLDYITLILTGSLVGISLLNSVVQRRLSPHETVIHIIAQFIFCLDVVSAIVLYIKLRKVTKIEKSEN